ncbi:MAG: putative peptidoglycan glycosyltransferase FtsW [bacterium]
MNDKQNHPDYILAAITGVLLTLGIILLAGISTSVQQSESGSPFFSFTHQVLFGLVPGLILGLLAFLTPLSLIKKWAPAVLFVNFIFLLMVFLPVIGIHSGGSSRWLNIGVASFQPSEFLKLTFILYLGVWLSAKHQGGIKVKTKKPLKFNLGYLFGPEVKEALIPFLVILGLISLVLILQPDISTLGLIILTGFMMYFLIEKSVWHTVLMISIGLTGLFALIKIAPYRAQRFLVFLNPETDPMGMGYQVKQALVAVGSGGLFGVGLGMSGQKFGFLPRSMSDSIFAILAEETGFIGATILILLFLIFLVQGFKIAKQSQDKFCQLTAVGISVWITIQAFVNIGAIIGVLPLTGIPLPFISCGGSHLVVELAAVGILLNISKNT